MNYGWLTVGIAAAASALMTVAVYPSPFFAMLQLSLTSLPLFLVGLAYGAVLGLAAAAAAFVALGLSMGLDVAAYHAAMTGVPAGLLIWQAERSGSHPRVLLLTLIAYACAMIALAGLYLSGEPGGMQGVIADELQRTFETISSYAEEAGQPPLPMADLQDMLSSLASLFPAFAAAGWVLTTAASAGLAQFVLRRFGKATLPTPNIADLRAPRWTAFVLVAVLALAYLPQGIGFTAKNMVPVVLLLFLFTGLGVVHALARRSGSGGLWLGGTYALLIVFSWAAAAVIVLVGMLDVVFDFRRRVGSPPQE